MVKSLRRFFLIVVIVSILVITTISYALFLSPKPGLYFSPSLYSFESNMTNDISSLLDNKNVVWHIHVSAIAPFLSNNDFVDLLDSCYSGQGAAYIPYESFKPVVDSWLTVLKQRHLDPNYFTTSLIISVEVFNKTDGKILYSAFDTMKYRPIDFSFPKGVLVKLNIDGNGVSFDEKNLWILSLPILLAEPENTNSTFNGSKHTQPLSQIETTISYIAPENLTGLLPGDFFKQENGKLYMKVPILIIDNTQSNNSATMGGSIDININAAKDYSLGIYPAFSAGNDIFNSLTQGILPNVNIRLGSGQTWGSYYFGYMINVPPGSAKWIYIWARPVIKFTIIHYYNPISYADYTEDRVYALVTDVLSYNNAIEGGIESGLPPQPIMNNLFVGTNETRVAVPTFTIGGILPVNGSIPFAILFNYYDKCKTNFEVGLAIGSLLGSSACSVLPGLEGVACGVATEFVSTFSNSLSSMDPLYMINGVVQNEGQLFEYGYNVPVILDMRVSKLSYIVPPPSYCFWCSNCTFSPPVALYFKAIPAG
ncbi:hypothetical protein [Fervidicoccus fontis]|uniref:Uncharacterized protein n=1 Tax=Fervidicoccus fontis (strain DSM 19380 / JCM 18336 / VKM B-2539 / Kam940) TaxID=1163730 RepID=I0A1V2_FERFK|nr:hypothetical protein [Fervidicoccus fontis]AFH42959.1 hypothetical protein FFONT_0971 [Fervidicoccus fontis Kam940]